MRQLTPAIRLHATTTAGQSHLYHVRQSRHANNRTNFTYAFNDNAMWRATNRCLDENNWISDKPATVIWINAHRPSSPAIEKIKNLLFGKLKISFTTDTVTTDLDGKVEKYSQKIIGQTQHAVAAITHDVNLDRDVIVTIEIDDDEMGYWIYNSQYDIKEHFIPVK